MSLRKVRFALAGVTRRKSSVVRLIGHGIIATTRCGADFVLERKRVWDLSILHPSGLRHAFYTTDRGVRLHYLVNARHSAEQLHTSVPHLAGR